MERTERVKTQPLIICLFLTPNFCLSISFSPSHVTLLSFTGPRGATSIGVKTSLRVCCDLLLFTLTGISFFFRPGAAPLFCPLLSSSLLLNPSSSHRGRYRPLVQPCAE